MDATAPTAIKPLLLVDIDGVLNPFAASGCPEDFYEDLFGDYDLYLCADHGMWLNELAELFELVWATTWEDEAVTMMAPRLHLPPMDVIHFERASLAAPTWKLADVRTYVADRPCAWIDDDLLEDAQEWADSRPVPTLLVRTLASVGMTRRHVDQLKEYALSLSTNS